jgi:hypothetical protein
MKIKSWKIRVEQRNEEKDKVLLEKELEKPSAARNKTLVNKYKARINESYSWPRHLHQEV